HRDAALRTRSRRGGDAGRAAVGRLRARRLSGRRRPRQRHQRAEDGLLRRAARALQARRPRAGSPDGAGLRRRRAVPLTVPITRLDLGDAEVAAAERVLRSGWIMMGPEVAAFERELGDYLGVPHVVAVASGTVALELTLRALGVGPGDEVVTVSHSFIATANAVVATGATPVFVDVEEDTLGLDPRCARAAIGPRTRVVMPVHQVGILCRIEDFGVPI